MFVFLLDFLYLFCFVSGKMFSISCCFVLYLLSLYLLWVVYLDLDKKNFFFIFFLVLVMVLFIEGCWKLIDFCNMSELSLWVYSMGFYLICFLFCFVFVWLKVLVWM